MDAFAGIWLVARTPRLWPLCLGPLLAALTAYVLLGTLGGVLLVPRLPGWLGMEPGSGNAWIVEILGGLAFVALWLVLFSFVFVLLAGVFSGFVWERLSLAVEALAGGGVPPGVPLGCGAVAGDSLARLLLNGTLGLAALLLSLFLGPIPGILVAALVGLLDYTAPSYVRRGHTLGAQSAHLLRRLDARTLGFALVAGLLSLVPVLGVLLMPGLVAGGTLLARRREV